MAEQELKDKVMEWFEKKSTGEKKSFYMKDVVNGIGTDDYDKKAIHKATNELIEEDKLMWYSTGSSSMVTLTRFHRG